ncbi:cytochrome c peroxidase [Bernardetia litoralis DSM 6794]|uniref:Methylamine utilization protein MauG n=1 Tax=Bernardetia litoralis (strain ATCC 23117 / DSM 6794 / NBRC 15988 / NCIMB 1366 / Fx l1 / Sio-4) TaxID=880071 RepID=I4AL58_BERLS|nr:cytochrome c peroxidase [Bernardetia litoralis]AFM04693.1 cytochrome c peroxidase [Bernardetia litoralis DSM 6794]
MKNILVLFLLISLSSCSEKENPEPETELTGIYPVEELLYFGDKNLPTDNITTYEGIELGRKLFYDKRLSSDGTVSCATCHKQELAFTDGKAKSIGVNNAEMSVSAMSLVNLTWNNRLTWDGKSQTLEEQAFLPMENHLEMNQDADITAQILSATDEYPVLFEAAFGSEEITPQKITKALAQFERTLISNNSKYDKYLRGEYQATESELRGIQLFFTHPEAEQGIRGGNCGDCHLGSLTSGSTLGFEGLHNNGLDNDENLEEGLFSVTQNSYDKGKFRTPSLRNIALTAPYMHDGRFQTLEEVIEHYDVGVQKSQTLSTLITAASNDFITDPNGEVRLALTEQEKQDIIAFLEMLTDEDFITNPAFSEPKQ